MSRISRRINNLASLGCRAPGQINNLHEGDVPTQRSVIPTR